MTRANSTRTAAWFDVVTKRKPPPAPNGRMHLLDGSQAKRNGPKRSDLQILALQKIAVAGLPEPVEELENLIPGRKYRFDLGWPDKRVLVELNGAIWVKGGHSSGTGIERDMEKCALAQLHGWRVLSVSSRMVKDGTLVKWLRLCL